ncbi:hypothetical protein GQ53DRAFT_820304 [Thozetella sp. PMI_491]|nr:hypothetical protein GQ53DRAFT_820304 [Thozetella sp. PMI_491]
METKEPDSFTMAPTADLVANPGPPYTTYDPEAACVPCTHICHPPAQSSHIHYHGDARSRANVVPVPLLQRHPALAQCPGCYAVSPTRVRYVSGKGTHYMGVFFFLFTGIGVFIPYAMNHFKNAEHSCLKCGRVLAVQKFGGSTKAYLI